MIDIKKPQILITMKLGLRENDLNHLKRTDYSPTFLSVTQSSTPYYST